MNRLEFSVTVFCVLLFAIVATAILIELQTGVPARTAIEGWLRRVK